MSRPLGINGAPDDVTSGPTDMVRLVAIGALFANGAFPIVEAWRILAASRASLLPFALFATVVTLTLHLWHVTFGLRNERPPAGAWTLASLALVQLLALVFVGRPWALQLGSLMVSVLIVMRGPAALAIVAALAVVPAILVNTPLELWHLPPRGLLTPPSHLVLALMWRTTTLYLPIRFVNTIGQLEATRREIEARAIQRTRTRIDGELRRGLGVALARIIARGEAAQEHLPHDTVEATNEIERLVKDARNTLAEARRVVAGYQSGSLRAELDAATALLEASGATARIEIGEGVVLDAAASPSREGIRNAVMRALEAQPEATYTLAVFIDDGGKLNVSLQNPTDARSHPEVG
jgi:signal transduction histidine kinase